jgi:hypothetical protein
MAFLSTLGAKHLWGRFFWSLTNITRLLMLVIFLNCKRFEKNDILRIVRALAIFRPSLIALQMPLSVEDEVFVEKCFQRSLMVSPSRSFREEKSQMSTLRRQELDKLISFSGTPTVVWRRTGEICLVAPEFCHLTEWHMDELLGRKTYIYEVCLLGASLLMMADIADTHFLIVALISAL